MKKAVLGLSLLGACCALPLASSAQAQVVAVDQYPCAAVMSDPSVLATFVLWTDGYLSSVTGDTVSNPEFYQEMVQIVGEYCKANPEAPFWNAIVENYNVTGEEE